MQLSASDTLTKEEVDIQVSKPVQEEDMTKVNKQQADGKKKEKKKEKFKF